MATFLASFNIGKATDEFGNEIEFDDSFNEFGVVMYVQILTTNLLLSFDPPDTRNRSSAVSRLDLSRFRKSSRDQDTRFECFCEVCPCTTSNTLKVFTAFVTRPLIRDS